MDKVRIGIIGVGGMGYAHCKSIVNLEETELTCVCDNDKEVAKEGEVISPQLANALGLLGIKPMKIGLDLMGVYENGFIFDKNVLKTVIANKKAWGERLKKSRAPWAHLEDESEHDTTLLFDEDDYQDLLPVRDEKYLRPTRLCEYDAPEIRILAKKLGAYDKEPIEYAKSIYYFVKNQKYLIFKPMRGALGVLKSRGGVCLDQMSLLISLARAGGIKARFRLYAFTASQELDELLLQDNPILRETYEMLGFLDSLHGCAELYIDGEWLQLDPTFSDELEAGMGIPIVEFGEEPAWRVRIPERDIVFEGFPIFFRNLLVSMALILRDTADKVNKN